ncbi:serine/threonine-protein kinase [Mycobacterium sp. DL99]|uniref:serine/threonine-protein kinase n=1 Tax=Mycobacterium sp. DL99 TaxID=2528957 RepID=UPI001080D336|nr:serine/threonine-protein kinase [Mycobacterium sp. DL99]
MPLQTGSNFAGFTVIQPLGSGGMGEVYLVEHPRLPRQEAIKILPASASQDPDYRDRFTREAELASSLWHPNIVALHDRGEADGQLWISMDYVRGQDAAVLARAYPAGLPLPQATAIATAVASALDYAHGHGMLHRDVKPANILLGESDHADQRILLADFGIARRTGDISGLTATNTTVGTVAYAAPEQLLGNQLDGRADQYALAATMFHLLAGTPPFVDSNPAVVIGKHLSAAPPPLSQFRPELARLDPVFARALAKSPADRYPKCSDLAQALASVGGGAVFGAPQSIHQQMTMPAAIAPMAQAPTQFAVPAASPRGTAAAVAVMLALLVLLTGAGVFTAWQWSRPTPHAATSTQWQPYTDFAKSFTERMMSVSAKNSDTDVDWILDNSTGAFRDDFASQRDTFVQTLKGSGVTTTATTKSVALKSFDDRAESAMILVAAVAQTASNAAPDQTPRSWRLIMTIEKVDGTFKTSKVEFAS